MLAVVRLRWWGIQIGQHSQFVGLPKIRRSPGSAIRIGSFCKFISLFSANSHGVDRPCFLAAVAPGSRIELGDYCGLSGTVITASKSIVLGKRVQCGANTLITDSDAHSLDAAVRRQEIEGVLSVASQSAAARPVTIHDDVWLGVNVTVLKGVEIGARTVVGAGSVVTKSLPADCIAAGVPARIIRNLRVRGEKTA